MRMKAASALGVLLALELGGLPSASAQETDFSPKFEDMTDADDVRHARALLNGDLKPEHLHLGRHACDVLLSATPGRVETIYTGVCRLKDGAKIMICGDTGVGEFGYKPWTGKANAADTKKALLDWTGDHCGGG